MESKFEKPKGYAKGLGSASRSLVCTVLTDATIVEIIDLCLGSSYVHECAQSVKPSISKVEWRVIAPNWYLIFLYPLDTNLKRTKLSIVNNVNLTEGRVLENDFEVDAVRYANSIYFRGGTSVKEKNDLFVKLSKFVMNLFKIEEFTMDTNIVDNIVDFHQEKFTSLKIVADANMGLSEKDIRLVLNHIEVDKLFMDTGPTFFEPKHFLLKHRRIEMPKAGWLTTQSIENSRCEFLAVGRFAAGTKPMAIRPDPIRTERLNIQTLLDAWYTGRFTLESESTMEFDVTDLSEDNTQLKTMFIFGPRNRVAIKSDPGEYLIRRRDGARILIMIIAINKIAVVVLTP